MVARTICSRRIGPIPTFGLTAAGGLLYLIGRPIMTAPAVVVQAARTVGLAAGAVGRRAGNLDEGHGGTAAEAVLRQATVPAREVLLLDEHGRERGGHAAVVGGLGLALETQRIGHAARLGEGGVALALRFRRDDLRLALGLDQLVTLLLGLLLLDLLGLDRLLVRRVEADVGQRG